MKKPRTFIVEPSATHPGRWDVREVLPNGKFRLAAHHTDKVVADAWAAAWSESDAVPTKPALDVGQHTPGPWSVGQSITASKPGRAPGSYERTTVAQRVNRRADSHLIAASPDMLAALEALANAFDGETDCTSILEMIGAKNGALRKAIAKARGRTL